MNATPRTLLKKATAPNIPEGSLSAKNGPAPPPKVGFMSPKTALRGLSNASETPPARPPQENQKPPMSPKPLHYRPEPKRSTLFGAVLDAIHAGVEQILLLINGALSFCIVLALAIVALRYKALLL